MTRCAGRVRETMLRGVCRAQEQVVQETLFAMAEAVLGEVDTGDRCD